MRRLPVSSGHSLQYREPTQTLSRRLYIYSHLNKHINEQVNKQINVNVGIDLLSDVTNGGLDTCD